MFNGRIRSNPGRDESNDSRMKTFDVFSPNRFSKMSFYQVFPI